MLKIVSSATEEIYCRKYHASWVDLLGALELCLRVHWIFRGVFWWGIPVRDRWAKR